MSQSISRSALGGLALAAAVPIAGRVAGARHVGTLSRLSGAHAAQNAALLDGEDGWPASASSTYPQTTCSINATALAFVQSVEGQDGVFVRSLVAQTNADIHNPYVLVGVTLGVSVDVIDTNGTTLVTFYHEAFAGAVLDPQGNNKAYTWIDNAVMPEARLDRIDHLRIRFSNVS
jgi:hypothetical protein